MKIRDGFILRRVASSYMALPTEEPIGQKRSVLTLSGSGAFLWRILEKGTTEQELLEALMSEYDVSQEVAKEDISAFLKALSEQNLLDEY